MRGEEKNKMKLWILLDENIQRDKLNNQDIILTNNIEDEKKYSANRVEIFNIRFCDEDLEVTKSVNFLFDVLPKEFNILKNTVYYVVFRVISSGLCQIEEIINRYNVKHIVLVGGSELPYITTTRGEGEGVKWWYRTSWLMSSVIFKAFSSENIEISWEKKEKIWQTKFRHLVRENILFVREILAAIKRYFVCRNLFINTFKNEKYIIVIAPLELQYRHLNDLMLSQNITNCIYITNYKNKIDKKLENQYIIPITMKKIYENILLICRTKANKVIYKYDKLNLELNDIYLKRSFKTLWLTNLNIISNYFNTIKKIEKKIDYVVTDMTFGSELQQIHRLCVENNIKHINFQYVAMVKLLFPEMELADEYYLYAHKVYSLYSKYSCIYKYYLPIKKIKKSERNGDETIVSIFTQPDMYTERYLIFINMFLEKLNELKEKIKVIIKFHYRQDKKEIFISYSKKYNFVEIVEGEESVMNVFNRSDFAMSMTSSILFEAFLVGEPAIILDIDGKDTEYISNNDFAVEEVNFRIKKIENLIDILKNKEKYKEVYFQRREKFIKENEAIKEIGEIFNDKKNKKNYK